MVTQIRALFSLCLVAVVALLAFASPAAAKRASTRIIISPYAPYFHGSLRSSRGGCKYGRTVRLYREEAGPDELITNAVSDASAEWTTGVGGADFGAYYALAPATGGCKPAKSAVVEI